MRAASAAVRCRQLNTPLPHQSYTAFRPDIMLKDADTMDLASFCLNGSFAIPPDTLRARYPSSYHPRTPWRAISSLREF
jgi:hypothetical protein